MTKPKMPNATQTVKVLFDLVSRDTIDPEGTSERSPRKFLDEIAQESPIFRSSLDAEARRRQEA